MEAKGRARATLTGGCARWVLLTDLRALRTEPATAEHRGQRPGMKRLRGHRSQSVVSTLVAAARRAAVLLAGTYVNVGRPAVPDRVVLRLPVEPTVGISATAARLSREAEAWCGAAAAWAARDGHASPVMSRRTVVAAAASRTAAPAAGKREGGDAAGDGRPAGGDAGHQGGRGVGRVGREPSRRVFLTAFEPVVRTRGSAGPRGPAGGRRLMVATPASRRCSRCASRPPAR